MVRLNSSIFTDKRDATEFALYSTRDDLPADFIAGVIRRAEDGLQHFENQDEKLVHVDTLVGWTHDRLANRLLEAHNNDDSPFATRIFFVAEQGSVEGDFLVAVSIDPHSVGNEAEIEGTARIGAECVLIDGSLISCDMRGFDSISLNVGEDNVRRMELDEPLSMPVNGWDHRVVKLAFDDDGYQPFLVIQSFAGTSVSSDPSSALEAKSGDGDDLATARLNLDEQA